MIPLKLSQLDRPPRPHNLTLCRAVRRRRSQAPGHTSAGALLWQYSKQNAWLLLRRTALHSVRLCWRGGRTNWESFNVIICSTLLMALSMEEFTDNTVPPDHTSESG